jgi:hypothetical protein
MKKLILPIIVALVTINVISVTAKDAAANQEMRTEVIVTNNVLKGVVFDKLTNESLAGVAIVVNGQKVYSDLDGNFTVSNQGNGNCELKISMISYEDQTLIVDLNKQNSLKIALNMR